MDGTLNKFPVGGYQPVHKGLGGLYESGTTPNFEVMEGMRFGQFYPAPYLPVKRFDPVFNDWVVIAAGTPVALDQNGDLIPAGYFITGAGEETYAQIDVDLGTKGFLGGPITVGGNAKGSVVASTVIGVASYDVYQRAGSDPQNPATFKYHNYQRQNGVAVLTDYLLEFPIEPVKRTSGKMTVAGNNAPSQAINLDGTEVTGVTTDIGSIEVRIDNIIIYPDATTWAFTNSANLTKDIVTFAAGMTIPATSTIVVTYNIKQAGGFNALFKGMATFREIPNYSDLVTFDLNSKYIPLSMNAIANDHTLIVSAMGKVTLIDRSWPKQLLDRVKTAYDPRLHGPIINPETGQTSQLDRASGSATDGMPHQLWYAGATSDIVGTESGIVRFNMNI